MAKLNRKQIQQEAMRVLEEHPQGIRWIGILRAIQERSPETPIKSIDGGVHNLLVTETDKIRKVARGTYRLAKYADAEDVAAVAEEADVAATALKAAAGRAEPLAEQDFYASFASWLEESDEATIAAALGGATLGGKWGTPDVIGVLKPRAQDIFKFEPQIVTAEIKVAPNQPVVAFGQAVAYRLFSHRSYIVVPDTTSSDDINRLKSLCSIHGVGLVTFTLDKEQPDYAVVVLPATATPDLFYVNAMLERLKSSEPGLLRQRESKYNYNNLI